MMRYQLLHWLFGWDYIAWTNSADDGVARVHRAADGRIYYWRYKITKVIDEIKSPDEVIWLTCPPQKYLTRRIHDQD